MELRRCNRSHFIWAIRGGSVIKVHNADSRGMPVLVFKKLKDIYENGDTKNPDLASRLQWQGRYADLVFDCNTVKTENPCFPLAERKTRKRVFKTEEFYGHISDVEKDSDLDDDKMTLNQLKVKCKTKKQKVSNSIDMAPKQEYSDSQLKEDEFDLKQPLSCWKSKISKSSKIKKKNAPKHVSTSCDFALKVKSEPFASAEEFMEYNGALPTSIDIKLEVLGPEYSECQNMNSVVDDVFGGCNEQVGLCGERSSEITEINKSKFKIQEPVSYTEEGLSCTVNEVSYDYMEQVELISSLPPKGRVDMEEINRSLVLTLSESKKGYTKLPLSHVSHPELTSPMKDQCSDMCESSQSHFSPHEISSPINSESRDQEPDVETNSSLYCMELGTESSMIADDVKEDLLSDYDTESLTVHVNDYSSSWNSYECLKHEDLVPLEESSPPIDEKHSSLSAHEPTTEICSSPDNHLVSMDNGSLTTTVDCFAESPYGHVNELSPSTTKRCDHSEMWHPPERLLSTRKAISPTSQERLCQAMDSIELKDDMDHYKYKGKLCFEKQNENKASSAGLDIEGDDGTISSEGPEQVNQVKVTINPKQITRKSNSYKKGSPPKGIAKGPHLSGSTLRGSTERTSIQRCSESAVAFSQRQMQDIEGLAMKLMKELKSMKDIVEENLNSEPYPTTFLKPQEVKTAIKNATKAEETSRKWLSIMARDCNRFCKIMRLTEKGANAPEIAIPKERRKITFADEAGGMLCHVKFFEDDMASAESESENNKLQVL